MSIIFVYVYLEDKNLIKGASFIGYFRRTKKAYISIVNDHILEMARSAHKEVSYNQLKIQFKRHNVGDIHMLFCRKIFATYLRLEGVEQEIIDLLQGSIPRNVFVRHYFRPNFAKENEKITISLEKLYEKIRCLLLEIDTDCIVNKSGSIIDIHVA